MAKKNAANDRRRRIEEMKRRQRAAERRKSFLVVGLSSLVGLALVGGTVLAQRKSGDDGPKTAVTALGANSGEAGCGQVADQPPVGGGDHMGPNERQVDYQQIPPTSGRHHPQILPGATTFYEPDQLPQMTEKAVHNLEHGYVVAWYDKDLPQPEQDVLREVAESVRPGGAGNATKFIAVPWDRGVFPDGRHLVLTAWGHAQPCTRVSGAVVQQFIDSYRAPKGDAPEKFGA